MSQFQCLSCSLSSSFHYCSGCFSSTRASSHISVLLSQVSAHLQECLRCTTGWWGAGWGLPWATGKLSSQRQGWWPQPPGMVWCYCRHCNLDKEASWTPSTEIMISTLRRADALQRNRWTCDLKKLHKNEWVYSSIKVRLCLPHLLPCHGQPQPVKHILPKRQVCTLGPGPISVIPHGAFPPTPGLPGTTI